MTTSFTIIAPLRYRQGTTKNPTPRTYAAWLTQNDVRRMHWAPKRDLVAAWKEQATYSALARRLSLPQTPIPHKVTITATSFKSGRSFDSDAPAPTVKACIDGLVQAGILHDDNPRHVGAITYADVVKVPAGEDRLVLTLTPASTEEEPPCGTS